MFTWKTEAFVETCTTPLIRASILKVTWLTGAWCGRNDDVTPFFCVGYCTTRCHIKITNHLLDSTIKHWTELNILTWTKKVQFGLNRKFKDQDQLSPLLGTSLSLVCFCHGSALASLCLECWPGLVLDWSCLGLCFIWENADVWLTFVLDQAQF